MGVSSPCACPVWLPCLTLINILLSLGIPPCANFFVTCSEFGTTAVDSTPPVPLLSRHATPSRPRVLTCSANGPGAGNWRDHRLCCVVLSCNRTSTITEIRRDECALLRRSYRHTQISTVTIQTLVGGVIDAHGRFIDCKRMRDFTRRSHTSQLVRTSPAWVGTAGLRLCLAHSRQPHRMRWVQQHRGIPCRHAQMNLHGTTGDTP